MHWITIRLSRQENICVSCVLSRSVTMHVLHVTSRGCGRVRGPTVTESCDRPVAPGAGHRSAGPGDTGGRHSAHQATHFLPISTRLHMENRRLVFCANCCNKLTQQHFSFPFKMTNDILSPVGQNRMQQCRDNISRVISGHWKQTISWAESYMSTSCPAETNVAYHSFSAVFTLLYQES